MIRLLLPFRIYREACDYLSEFIYRGAVFVDSFWLTKVLGIKIDVVGPLPIDKKEKLLVISNHHSWFDIFLLQHIVSTQGPILKFLVKRALVYVPIIGWICLALRFPLLNRSSDKEKRKSDYKSVQSATMALQETPVALLNFVEGTRFTPQKRLKQDSAFEVLLNPRSGGLKIMIEGLPEASILDVTLAYPSDNQSFWQCLSGNLKKIDVHIERHSIKEIDDLNQWLNDIWQEKEQRILLSRNQSLSI